MTIEASSNGSDGLPSGWRDRVSGWAITKERIHELYLFGSRAKGDFAEESDVDLAYVLTGEGPGEVLAYSICECGGWQSELERTIGVTVDLQMASPHEDAVVWPAVREHGQLIYRKSGWSPVA